ncbi:MAG: prephenate dehydrogenase [Candidatus Omnitrophica bacterium]|nr:prephenate dehydrogenase [Candidatus Omnitrophota bacterium]
MKLFNKVAIIGTGLIGGSLALDIKKKKLASSVVGVSRRKISLAKAKKMGAIDTGSRSLSVIRGADLVVFATPVSSILSLAPKISKIIDKKCVVIDVGSTKEEIVSRLSRLFPGYVGTHPLAGSEKRSVNNAKAGLFKGSLCILTPTARTDKKALNKVVKLWLSLGAKTVDLQPSEHDLALSFVSHLPHVAAFSLMNSVPKEFMSFGSGGLKDTTRIAASDSGIWADIFLSNSANIIKASNVLNKNISLIKAAIANKNRKKLVKILAAAQAKREKLG